MIDEKEQEWRRRSALLELCGTDDDTGLDNSGVTFVRRIVDGMYDAGYAAARQEQLEFLLQHLPEALAQVKALPDIIEYWLDLAYGVTPTLMVRYDRDDPKTERVRLWTVDALKEKWQDVETASADRQSVRDEVCEAYQGGLGDNAMQRAWMRYAEEQEVPHDHEDEESFKYGFDAGRTSSVTPSADASKPVEAVDADNEMVRVLIPCPDGREGCLVAHSKLVPKPVSTEVKVVDGWTAIKSESEIPADGRYLFALRKADGDIRLAIFNVREKPWLGVKILAWMPLPEYTGEQNDHRR